MNSKQRAKKYEILCRASVEWARFCWNAKSHFALKWLWMNYCRLEYSWCVDANIVATQKRFTTTIHFHFWALSIWLSVYISLFFLSFRFGNCWKWFIQNHANILSILETLSKLNKLLKSHWSQFSQIVRHTFALFDGGEVKRSQKLLASLSRALY